ncbi:polymorphic toxin type 50 domain-containing protein [Aerococcus christensenii]|uniref:polymorphic toxin type 50 domain-containing protein n=1 Tax=Aerococcus christensenii TaxID=87541 RepID=UPI000AFF6087|nr:polymorphic toxin type 50 domain-containing protein [Aerococcus christensenii]
MLKIEEGQKLIDQTMGKGLVVCYNNGEPKKQEDVNFHQMIGYYVKDGKEYPTTKGRIHYGKNGAHIVPEEGSRFD